MWEQTDSEVVKYDKQGKRKKVNKKTATKFCSDYPAKYLELFRRGGTKAEFCRMVDVGLETLNDWIERYPEMGAVAKRAKKIAEGWWLEQARNHVIQEHMGEGVVSKLDTSLYKHYTGGRFKFHSDKALHDAMALIAQLEAKIATMQTKTEGAYAEEPKFELIDDSQPK